MTYKEKLEVALGALKNLSCGWDSPASEQYAAEVYAELTAPRMEPVEVKVWKWNPINRRPVQCSEIISIAPAEKEKHLWIELTGTYSRPIEEKEEVWEGRLVSIQGDAYARLETGFDMRLLGSQVEVRLKGE